MSPGELCISSWSHIESKDQDLLFIELDVEYELFCKRIFGEVVGYSQRITPLSTIVEKLREYLREEGADE